MVGTCWVKSCEGGEAVQVLVTIVLAPKAQSRPEAPTNIPHPQSTEVWALQAEVEEMCLILR